MKALEALKNFDVSDISVGDYVILSAATQLGLFEYLASGRIQQKEVDQRYVEYGQFIHSLVNALISYGYLFVGKDGCLLINPDCREILLSNKSIVLKNYDWYFLIAQAPSLIAKRQKPSLLGTTYNYFIDISEELSKLVLPILKNDLPELFKGQKKVLDVGCGKMGLFRQVLKENPLLEIIGIDQTEYSTNFIKETVKNSRLSNNVSLVEGNAVQEMKMLDGEYDFILLSHLIHWMTKEETISVLRSCRKLLRKGGTCIIYEDYIAKDGFGPKSNIRKNLSLVVMGYQIFNETQIKEMVRLTGFRHINFKIVGERRILFYCN